MDERHPYYDPSEERKLSENLFKNINLTPGHIKSVLQEPLSSLYFLISGLEADLRSELESISHEMNDAIRKFMQLCLTEL